MRQKRKKKKGGSNSGALLKYIVLVAAGGTMAISLGFYTAKYLILPKITDTASSGGITIEKNVDTQPVVDNTTPPKNVSEVNDKPKETKPTNEATENKNTKPVENSNTPKPETSNQGGKYTIKLPALDVYNVQVGSFDKEIHAKTMVTELHKKNLGGYIVATDRYRVSTMAVASREAANTYKEIVKENYSDAFIAVINVPVREVSYNEGSEEINKSINAVVVQINSYLNRVSEFVSKDLDSATKADIDKFADEELVLLESIQTGLGMISPSDPKLSKLHSNVKVIIDDSVAKFKAVKASSEKDVAAMHEVLLIGMNGYAMANN